MAQCHNDCSFKHFGGRRLDGRDSWLPSLASIITAHDWSPDERDNVLLALIDVQLKLRQAQDIISRQDRAIATLTSASTGIDSQTSGEWIGYRLFWGDNCNYFHHLGFFSRGTLRNIECVDEDEKATFLNHVAGRYAPNSCYMSVSDIPGRLWNLPASRQPDFEVAVIDLKKLQSLGYPVSRTTELKQHFRVHGHIDYVTESHILVSPIIPHSCILGFLSKSEFRVLCLDKNILPGDFDSQQPWETQVIDLKKRLEQSDFSLRPESRCGKPIYYQVPAAPPLVRRKFKLNKTKRLVKSSVDEAQNTNVEDQLQALCLED
jgi:hypothetical protein